MQNLMTEFKEMVKMCGCLLNCEAPIDDQVRRMLRFLTPVFKLPSWFYEMKSEDPKYRDLLEELHTLYNKKITDYKGTDLEEIAYYVNEALNEEYIYFDDGEKWRIY